MLLRLLQRRYWIILLIGAVSLVLFVLLSISDQFVLRADYDLPANPIYSAPLPDAKLVSPHTTLAFRYGAPLDDAILQRMTASVVGAKSGAHPGRLRLATDNQTIIFQPDQPFALDEKVSVAFELNVTGVEPVRYTFTTAAADPAQRAPIAPDVFFGEDVSEDPGALQAAAVSSSSVVTYHTIPGPLPLITVTTPANGVADGYLFLTNFQFKACPTDSNLLIMDNQGEPIFYRRMPNCLRALNFERQDGGLLTYYSTETRSFHALDNTYTEVDAFATGNGYTTDSHELQLLSNGHALLLAYDREIIDNSAGIVPNGRPTATVIGTIVQELDVDKNVVFEWRSWDHFLITDTVEPHLGPGPVDYVHTNAIEVEPDGNLLISNRHMNEITKIDRQTGAIIWRLGGKNNQFTFVNEPRPFSHQHDVRRLPNGDLTIFDNGNFLNPPYSRAVEYKIDETNMTATLVQEYRHSPDVVGLAMGSNQLLSNDNVLVGWGALSNPAVTEFHRDGSTAFELQLPTGDFSYRAFRFPWHGYPTTPPTLVVVNDTTPTLYYSWNGATEILDYHIYGGVTATPNSRVDTTLKASFETKYELSLEVLSRFCYFLVRPIDKTGQEQTASNTVSIDTPGCQPSDMTNRLYLPLIGR